MKTQTVNRSYSALAQLGKYNRGNRFHVVTSNVTEIGVAAITEGNKQATTLNLLVPGRTRRGSRRAAAITLNGSQARQLFDTLATHYTARQ